MPSRRALAVALRAVVLLSGCSVLRGGGDGGQPTYGWDGQLSRDA
ncbi:MAG: hypothetical protein ABEJ90_03135 [Halobacterium sp.]